MEREYVESSMLTSIGYDSTSSIVEVEYKSNGQVWQYYDVPDSIYYEVRSADSIGRAFNSMIKKCFQAGRIN